jgi:hypothetical protein
MTDLRQQLLRSLAIEAVPLVLVQPVALDEEYWSLHRKSAAGLTTDEEEARLTAWCAAREAEAGEK